MAGYFFLCRRKTFPRFRVSLISESRAKCISQSFMSEVFHVDVKKIPAGETFLAKLSGRDFSAMEGKPSSKLGEINHIRPVMEIRDTKNRGFVFPLQSERNKLKAERMQTLARWR